MQLTDTQVALVASICLNLLPHLVALVPGLSKAEGIIGAILKGLAANYGYAKNVAIDVATAVENTAAKPVDQQDVVTPKPE